MFSVELIYLFFFINYKKFSEDLFVKLINILKK